MTLRQGSQVLRTRDDPDLVAFEHDPLAHDAARPFLLTEGASCGWARQGKSFGAETLRPRIEPWLTALVQSEHLSLLIGSGLTHAVHRMAVNKPSPGMDAVAFDTLGDVISAEAKRTAAAVGRREGNFEDQVRVASELLRGLDILATDKARATLLRNELGHVLTSFAQSILDAERDLILAPTGERERAFNYLVSFLMSFASRSGIRERLQLFTTNYDRYVEAGADAAGLRLIDRFVGIVAPIFRASRLDVDLHYNPPGMRGEPRYLEGVARFTKLHGSVDWVDCDRTIQRLGLPFGAHALTAFLGASPGLRGQDATRLMIYPNAAKDRETASHPYVELFRDLAAAICRPNSTLVCYGYGFGDEHINRVIEDMLTIPSSHLVVIAYGDPLDRILTTCRQVGRQAQITVLLGDHLGDLRTLVDNYLPKPAIDRTTFRMAELLKARWGSDTTRPESGEDPEAGGGAET